MFDQSFLFNTYKFNILHLDHSFMHMFRCIILLVHAQMICQKTKCALSQTPTRVLLTPIEQVTLWTET